MELVSAPARAVLVDAVTRGGGSADRKVTRGSNENKEPRVLGPGQLTGPIGSYMRTLHILFLGTFLARTPHCPLKASSPKHFRLYVPAISMSRVSLALNARANLHETPLQRAGHRAPGTGTMALHSTVKSLWPGGERSRADDQTNIVPC
jgi:hypothetical protein